MSGAEVVLVGPCHPHRGGIAQYTGELFRALAEGGPAALIGFRRLYPALLFPGRSQLEPAGALEAPAGERIIDPLAPLSWRRAAARVRELGASRLVFQWWHPLFAPAYAAIARLARVRTVFVCHNLLPHERHPADRWLTGLALSRADRLVVHGEQQRALAGTLFPGIEAIACPHPVYRHLRRPGLTREAARAHLGLSGNVLLFFGLVRRYKGLEHLLAALPAVCEQVPVTLLVVGEFYEPRARYDALIARLGLGERVRVVDEYVPDAAVAHYFTACDAVVCPYTSASQSGVVPLAYGFERPVVCTRAGGLPDAVRDGATGYLAEPGDAADLARAIVRFYAARGSVDHGAAVRALAAELTWSRLAEAVLGG